MTGRQPGKEGVPLAILLFGVLEVSVRGVPLPRLRSRKGHGVLALLCLRRGGEVERSWVAGTLWPDSSEQKAAQSLRTTLNDLRRALGAEAGRLRPPTPRTLTLDLDGATVDVIAFDAATQGGAGNDVGQASEAALADAVALYRGPLLEGWAEEWAFQERQRREQAYLEALELLAARAVARKECAAAEPYLRRAIAVDPSRETAQRALMQTLAATGNYAAAVQTYRELRHHLHRELNADPDPETQALFNTIREEARQRASDAAERADERTRGRAGDTRNGSGTASSEDGTETTSPPRPLADAGNPVTFLLTDVEGSTRLWEEHPEAMSAAIARHEALMAERIAQHRGTVVKSRGEGDSLFAVFPRATDAVAAACALQRALASEPWPAPLAAPSPGEMARFRVRMALHTGGAELRDGDYYGRVVNRCARLRAIGHGGQVLLSRATYELVSDALPEGVSLRDLDLHRLTDLQRLEHVFQLIHPALPADFPPLRSLNTRPNNLPQPVTSFIGRESEVEEVKELLGWDPSVSPSEGPERPAGSLPHCRLLTMTGVGGVGKTRLALQVAADLLPEYPDGIWFVELAPVSDPNLVPQTVADVLGIREEPEKPILQTLVEALKPRRLLLLLDNCEHLRAECTALARALLRDTPGVRLLATGRQALGFLGEQKYPVSPLSVPDPRRVRPTAENLTRYEAVRLFLARARLSHPTFTITDRNAPSVAQICCRLDGIPLALELAAARVSVLPVEKLNERFAAMFRVSRAAGQPALARHQTLQALIDWSYDLLTEAERRLLQHLSVFAGGWMLEAAEAVCPGDDIEAWEVLGLHVALVEKSLVQYEEQEPETRYRLLETIREYAGERLRESGERRAVRERHAGFFLRLAEEGMSALMGPDQAEWLQRLEQEYDNLRAALDAWVELDRPEEALRLAGALWPFSYARGHWSDSSKRLAAMLALDRWGARTKARASALLAAGGLAAAQGAFAAARKHLQESLDIHTERDDALGMADALNLLGALALDKEDEGGAEPHLQQALRLLPDDDHARRGKVLHNLAEVASRQDRPEEARNLYDQALHHREQAGDLRGQAETVGNFGVLEQMGGDLEKARDFYGESLRLSQILCNRQGIAVMLNNLGEVEELDGRLEAAAILCLRAQRLFRELQPASAGSPAAEARSGYARLCDDNVDRLSKQFAPEVWKQIQAGAEACARQDLGVRFAPTD